MLSQLHSLFLYLNKALLTISDDKLVSQQTHLSHCLLLLKTFRLDASVIDSLTSSNAPSTKTTASRQTLRPRTPCGLQTALAARNVAGPHVFRSTTRAIVIGHRYLI